MSSDAQEVRRNNGAMRVQIETGTTDSVTFQSQYDASGNRTRLAATIGSTDDFVTDTTYDPLGRTTRIEQHGVTGGNAVADKRIELDYNAAGQFDSLARHADTAGTQSVATTDYLYDDTGRLTDLTHAKGSTTLADYDFTYDAASQLTQLDSLTDGTSTFTNDLTGQLTDATHASQTNESYTFDENGNRTGGGTSTGDDNQLLSDGTYNYQYDAEGNRTRKTEIATGESTDYVWDHRNRLVQVVHRDSSGTALQTLDYTYDVFDRRIGKTDTPAVGPAYREHYVHDGDHVALRFGAGNLENRYVHGPNVDQILADEQVDSPTTAGDVLWPLTDHLGTVRDIAEYDAGSDITTIANHIVYDSFGNRVSETNASVDVLFGYTGREWDAAAELQYNRARWYDPAVGRWLSQDPIGFAAGDTNLYRYVGNQPTTLTDPSGLRYVPTHGPPPTETNGAWQGVEPPLPKPDPTVEPKMPPVLTSGEGWGTIKVPDGEPAINVFGEGENPDLPDYSTDPEYDDPDFEGPKPKRPNTKTLPDNSVTHICVRNSPLLPKSRDEITRITRPGGTLTVVLGNTKQGLGKETKQGLEEDDRIDIKSTWLRKFPVSGVTIEAEIIQGIVK